MTVKELEAVANISRTLFKGIIYTQKDLYVSIGSF